MDDSYLETTPAYMSRGLKLFVLLTALRVQHPARWAAFLSLNPGIRSWLQQILRARHKDPLTVDRRVRKLANLVSVALLYLATSSNRRIPKDYVLLYLCETYYGQLVPPSSPIVVSPLTAAYSKLGSYSAGGWVQTAYRNKHYLLFPMVCGQVLLHYLTPTQYMLNQLYFSAPVKRVLLDPIWKQFRLGVLALAVAWPGLSMSYARHNALLFLYMTVVHFQARLWGAYYRQAGQGELRPGVLLKGFVLYCAARANAVANLVYAPNLLAMLLLSITAPAMAHWQPLKRYYAANPKQTIKSYMRLIGFLSGLAAMLIESMNDDASRIDGAGAGDSETADRARSLGPDFYNRVCFYLAQLIVLSKWRILKENHPWFTLLKVGTWRRMETALMCILVWKLMNLNDHVRTTVQPGSRELERLRSNPWLKAVDRIMK